jgi:transketolase
LAANEKDLRQIAKELRLSVVRMVHHAKDGHPGPALSCADIITALYFNAMHIDAKNPQWEDRDRMILSKGHACPVLYAALAKLGFFDSTELDGLRNLGSILQGHPTLQRTPGLDMTSGSLGNGLAIGQGMALAAKYLGKDYYTYVILGDGETQEGVVWETAMSATHYHLSNLIAFIDNNGFQSGGNCAEVTADLPHADKWWAFGWYVQEIDGHDMGQILKAVENAKAQTESPSMIIARTVKGKGLAYMENDNSWHKRVPTDEQLRIAEEILGGIK